MKTLSLKLNETEYESLREEAANSKQTISDLVRLKLFPNATSYSVAQYLDEIIKRIDQRRQANITNEFSIPHLFNTEEWSGISRGMRLQIGRSFKQKVDQHQITNIIFNGKNIQNWAIYKIIA